jgi:hypothetical protein
MERIIFCEGVVIIIWNEKRESMRVWLSGWGVRISPLGRYGLRAWADAKKFISKSKYYPLQIDISYKYSYKIRFKNLINLKFVLTWIEFKNPG